MSEKKSLIKAAGLVSAITLLSRILGLIRDAVIAATLGAGYYSDCFNIAFEIPNLTRRVLGEGALSAFIVPIYSRMRKEKGDRHGWIFVSNALNIFILLTSGMTLAGILLAKPLFILFGGIKFYAMGEEQFLELGVSLTRIMFPFLIFLAVASLLMGVLHSRRHFLTPALGSVTLNITIIVTSLFFLGRTPRGFTYILALAVLAGAALRVAILIPPLLKRGFRYRPVLRITSPPMRRLYKMMLPATLGLAVVHINISVDANFANFLGPGRITYLRNANRLIQFPLALFATAISTAILPQLTSFLIKNERKNLEETISFAFRLLMILFIPATVGLIALGRPIVELILQRGYWNADDTYGAYFALIFYALGLLPLAFIRIITPLYYARQNVMTPFKVGVVALLTNIVFNSIFIFLTPLEHGGLALASSISAAVNFYLLFRMEKDVFGDVFTRKVRKVFYSTLAASLVMGFSAWGAYHALAALIPPVNTISRAVSTLGAVGGGALTYLIFGRMLKIPEFDRALRLVLRRK